MATTISTQDIVDAKRDIDDIGKAVNEKVIVSPRYGEDFKSLPLIVEEGNQEIINLQNAIDIAAAAGAGENGWTASLVVDNNGNSLQSVKDRVVAPEDFYKNTDNGDFRPAFQRAVDYLGVRGGGEVKLTSGKEYLFKTNGGVNSVDQVGFVIVQSNITFSGDRTAVIKIDANLGNYKSIFIQAGGPTSDVQNVQFKGFTIDQNIQNNPNTDILVFPSKNTLAAIWIAARASSIYVEDMCFKNAPGINIVGIASPLGNDIRVNRNLVYFLRGPSTAPNYDHSSIYIDAASFQCVENMAFNLSRTANDKFSIGSAYEVHGSLGSCDDNVAVGFSTFINAVGNLNEASTTKGINGLSIQRNKGYKVLNGIKLLAIKDAPLRGVTVKDNYAFISYGEFEPTSGAMVGVSLWPASGEPNTLISKVYIQNNIIVYEKGFTSSTAYALSAGIALESYNTVEDIEISGNKIFDAMFSGISIRQQQGLFSRIVVKDNFIKDAGQNTTGVKHGIAWRGTVIDSKCTGNEVIDTDETLKLQYAVYSSDLSAGSSLGVRGNKLSSPNSTTLLRSAAAETTQDVDTHTINSMGGTIQLPIPQGYLLFDVKLSNGTLTTLGSSVVAVDPVPHGTEVTIYITNNHTGYSNFGFTPSFALISPVVAIPSGSRSFFKFMYDAVLSKWYQSSPQVTHSN